MSTRKFFRIASWLVLPAFLLTCDDNDEMTPRPYPKVRTVGVSEITSEGAVFEGELVSLADGVIDHGFMVSRSASFSTVIEMISLGATSQTGSFTGSIEVNMEEGVKYYVRSFAKSKTHQVWGNIVDFISLGSKAPELLSIAPATGTWGTKVTLKGKRFTSQLGKVSVKFGDINASVETATPDSIVVRVPTQLLHAPSDVSVTVFGNVSKLVEAFQLTKPVITSINPGTGHVGTPVVIKGSFFRTPQSEVRFNNVLASVTKTTSTEIECLVPQNAGFGDVTVKVSTGTGNLFAETSFEIPKPTVLDFNPKTGTYRNTITISAHSLNVNSQIIRVKIGVSEAPIVSLTETEIKVTVPDYLTTPANEIKVTTEAGETIFPSPFTLLPIEITSIQPTDRLYTNTDITINGKNFGYTGNVVTLGNTSLTLQSEDQSQIVTYPYSGSFDRHELSLSVTASGQTATIQNVFYNEWIQLPQQSPEFMGSQKGLLIDDELYIINGSPFFRYNQTSSAWIELRSLPVGKQDEFVFSLNGKGYVGGGTYDAIQQSPEFYQYNPSTDNWTRMNDVPFSGIGIGFTVNNTGYVVASEYPQPGQLWKYNLANDSWTQLNDVAEHLIPRSGFIHNGDFYGLTYSNYLVRYDEVTDSWQQLEEFPYIFMYELDGRLYFYNGAAGIYSYDINALNEIEHFCPFNGVLFGAYSVGGKGIVFGRNDWWGTSYTWEYKPYEE